MIICDRIWEKGALCTFPEFCFKRLYMHMYMYLWNHSSYELQTWHEYSSIILLHSLQIAGPAHFRCGQAGDCISHVRKTPLFGSSLLGTGSLLRLPTLDLWSRPKLLVWSLGLSLLWNGDKLRSDKKSRFAWSSAPFLKSGHIHVHCILVVMKIICAGRAFAKVVRFLWKHTGMHMGLVAI